jgi:hypothetical protein
MSIIIKTMITLPENFVTGLISTMGQTITDVLPLVLFIVGILLSIYIISSIAWNTIENKKEYFNNKK